MQDFVLKTKNIIKKIAVIGTMTLMGATAIAGAAAASYTLADYPEPFVQDGKWVGLLVIGADAASADMVGAIDIAGTLAQVSAGVSEEEAAVTGGKSEDMLLDHALNEAAYFGSALDDDDLAGLQDTTITIDIGTVEDDYDVHDELRLTAGISLETGLTNTNPDEDFKDNVFIEEASDSVGYYYVFDDDLVNGNYIENASSDEPIDIDFLGKKLTIVGAASNTAIKAQVGEEVFLAVGDTVTISGHEVKLLNVGSAATEPVIVSVDGVTETVTNTEKVGALRVMVKETFYSDTLAERSATLVIGEDAEKTYADGDEFIGQDEDDPDWVWVLGGLRATAKPTIGISFDQTWDEPDEVTMVGSDFVLPDDYIKISPVDFTETRYQKYTIEAPVTEDIYNGTIPYMATAKLIHIEGAGNDDSFTVTAGDTDDIYLYQKNATAIGAFYKDKDDNKIKLIALKNGTTVDYNIANITYQDTVLPITVDLNATGNGGNITLATTIGNDIDIWFQADATNNLTYLGHGLDDTLTTGDLMYGARDISGWEENTRAADGIIIYDPDAHLSGDSFEFDIPADDSDFKVDVIVSSTGTTVTRATAAGKTTLAGVPLAKLDTEITDNTAANMILVGGSAVNKLTAEAMGVTYPTYGAASGIPENKGLIKLIENAFGGSKVALVVAGWEATNTRDACAVLKDYSAYTLAGTAMEVSPGPTVTAFVAPTVTTTEENTTV